MAQNLFPVTDRIPFVVLIPLLVALVAVPCAVGYLVGRRAALAGMKPDASISTVVGSTLGLLAFMLAFAFNAAYGRYDTRRQLTLTEATAIEMTFRDAGMLPGSYGPEIQRRLGEYLDVRLRAVANPETLSDALARSRTLLDEMWTLARAAAVENPSSQVVRLMVDSLSETTKVHTLRVTAGLRSRTPPTIWLALSLICVLAMSGVGYQSGLAGNWRALPLVMSIIAFTTVMALIGDLDRPQEGLVRVNQGALEDVRDRLFKSAP